MPAPSSMYRQAYVGSVRPNHKYFTEFTFGKAFLYTSACLYVIATGLASVVELFVTIPCEDPGEILSFENPAYDASRCPHIRYAMLMGLSKEECSFARRLVASILLGGLIGWERRQADRPAGIRTMSLVSLGSCLFTINSAFAFVNGPMNWDSSRVSAAIPSGVGFLGAGLIFKKEDKDSGSMVVHGLTTAASVWISAAVGIACGGELYFASSFGVALMMLLLRFGPRSFDTNEDEEEENGEIMDDMPAKTSSERARTITFQTDELNPSSIRTKGGGAAIVAGSRAAASTIAGYGAATTINTEISVPGGEDVSLMSGQDGLAPARKKDIKSIRKRAALASMV